jgi:hypothetical protein
MQIQLQKTVQTPKDQQTELSHALVREYKQTRWVANSERIGKPDALSAWYSIEEMEKFIRLAKEHGGDGVKFYYGAYPENYREKSEYADRQTLVMVATKSGQNQTGQKVNKDMYRTQNGRNIILSGNHPTLCPPYCSSGSEGGMGNLGITIVDKGEKGMEVV